MEQIHRRRWLHLALLAGLGLVGATDAGPGTWITVEAAWLVGGAVTPSGGKVLSGVQRAAIRHGFTHPRGPETRARRRVVLWDEAIVEGVITLSEHAVVRLRDVGP
jgi:hypothetical protein